MSDLCLFYSKADLRVSNVKSFWFFFFRKRTAFLLLLNPCAAGAEADWGVFFGDGAGGEGDFVAVFQEEAGFAGWECRGYLAVLGNFQQ